MINMSRRQMMFQLSCSMLGVAASAAHALPPAQKYVPWQESIWQGRSVFRQGASRRAVILLHELNGLSRSCIGFGQELVDEGFQIHMPLLFGHFCQDAIIPGFLESCMFGEFHCNTSGKNLSSATKPINWVQAFVNRLATDAGIDQIGVIGMCQSGAFPIVTMKEGSKVRAVVLSQPALPLGQSKQSDVGLSESAMADARKSKTPILAFRFAADTLCTASRFNFLESYFGAEQFRPVIFDHCDCEQTITHRCHSVLTGPTEDARNKARATVKKFFDERLSTSAALSTASHDTARREPTNAG